MHQSDERPFGLSALAVLIAIKGFASLAMALDLVTLDLAASIHTDEPVAGVALVIGLSLLYKAYGLWRLHRSTWLLILVLVALDGAAAAVELLLGARTTTVWISLAVALGTELYLLRPAVRKLFSAEHTGQ